MDIASPRKSTIVRTVAPHPVRAAFAALDVLAPSLSARWALRIWCTLPTNAGRRRDDRPGAGVMSSVAMPDGPRLAVETWGEGEPVYLVHGWGGWRGQLGAFVAPLVERGHRVVAFDAPSHGDSQPGALGPRRGSATEMARAFTAVVRSHGAPRGVIAHSLGAATTSVLIRDGLEVQRFVLIGPTPNPLKAIDLLRDALGYGERTHSRFMTRLQRLAGRPLTDIDITAAPPDAASALIVHDRKDKEVAYDDVVRLAESWPQAHFEPTDGLGHQRILRDPGVVNQVVEFIAS